MYFLLLYNRTWSLSTNAIFIQGANNLLAYHEKVFTEYLRLMPIAEFIRSFGHVKQTAVGNTYILLTAKVQMFHSTSP